jgi:hypothetical protein
MLRVGFQLMIQMFDRAKIFRALDHAAKDILSEKSCINIGPFLNGFRAHSLSRHGRIYEKNLQNELPNI